jgi:hypothetical protein
VSYFLITEDIYFHLRLIVKTSVYLRSYCFFDNKWYIDVPMDQPSIIHPPRTTHLLFQFEDDKR